MGITVGREHDITARTLEHLQETNRKIQEAKQRAVEKYGDVLDGFHIYSMANGRSRSRLEDDVYTEVTCYVLDKRIENPDPYSPNFEEQLDEIFGTVARIRMG